MRPSYQSFRSSFQQGVAACAGVGRSAEVPTARATRQTASASFGRRFLDCCVAGWRRWDKDVWVVCRTSLGLRCKAFVSRKTVAGANGTFARDAGRQGTAARRIAPPDRCRALLRGRRDQRLDAVAGGRAALDLARRARDAWRAGWVRGGPASRAPHALARADDRLVGATRTLVGLREPRVA